jgi:hypothetical protein
MGAVFNSEFRLSLQPIQVLKGPDVEFERPPKVAVHRPRHQVKQRFQPMRVNVDEPRSFGICRLDGQESHKVCQRGYETVLLLTPLSQIREEALLRQQTLCPHHLDALRHVAEATRVGVQVDFVENAQSSDQA